MQIQRNGADSYPSDAFISWRWDDWIKPQIDIAVALGANTVKWSGGTRSVVDGRQTRAQFHGHISEFIEYAGTQGLHVYWSSHFLAEDLNADDPATLDEIVAMMALVGSYENVIGNDCSNEANDVNRPSFPVVANQQAFYTAIKDVTGLPLSVSTIAHTPGELTLKDMAALDPYVDFWDVHPYYDTGDPVLGDFGNFRSSAYYKPWVIGECGAKLSAGQQAQVDRYSALDSLSQAPDCGGVVAYTVKDATGARGGTYTDDYGMYAYDTGAERPWMTTAFKNWPTSYSL